MKKINEFQKIKMFIKSANLHFNEVETTFNNYVEIFNSRNLFKSSNSKLNHIINNHYSIFFYMIYIALDFNKKERIFFGLLNNCFRLLVTGADNLLDADDNHYLKYNHIKKSAIMKSVFDLLLAEKIISTILYDFCFNEKLFDREMYIEFQKKIFDILAEVGINESEEYQKKQFYFSADRIINEVHHIKSGKLFTLPFAIPKFYFGGQNKKLNEVERAIYDFGIGVQIIDDLTDIIEDFTEKKPNYFIALVNQSKKIDVLKKTIEIEGIDIENKFFCDYFFEALKTSKNYITPALRKLQDLFDGFDEYFFDTIVKLVFRKLKAIELYEYYKKI
ncbi:MAG TPA: polyprenyl synthetase family protein [bacterium]|nr:polyprenyl synthetase family protein [bacterium]